MIEFVIALRRDRLYSLKPGRSGDQRASLINRIARSLGVFLLICQHGLGGAT